MHRAAQTIACLTAGLFAVMASHAQDLSNGPYSQISIRNIFALQPVAATIATPSLPVIPDTVISPKGIMTILGPVQVLFNATTAPTGAKARQNSYILGENERQDDIQVIRIDETAGTVTFDNHGVLQTLVLPNATGTAPVVTSGTPAVPKPYRPPMVGAIGSGRIPPYLGNGDENSGQTAQPPRTPEQQMLMIEALRAYYKSHNDPRADTLPPTAMTPSDAVEPATGQQ